MFTLILVFTVLFIFIFNSFYQKRKLIKILPPGPPPIPLLGNIHQIDHEDSRKTFVKWRELYGPVYTCWVGREPFVHVCDYETMYETFVKHGENYINRPPNWLFEHMLKGKNGILLANGEFWKEQRRFTLHTLRNFGFGRKLMEEKVLAETKIFTNTIDELLTKSKTTTVIDIEDDLAICICNVIASLLVGKSYSKNDPTLQNLKSSVDKLLKITVEFKGFLLYSFSWLRFVPLFGHFGFDEFRKTNETIFKIISEEIERHKKSPETSEEPSDFIFAYLQEIKKRNDSGDMSKQFNEWQLTCTVYDLWLAGMETTVTTLRWAFILMMKYPEIQQKVQNEIDSVIGSKRIPTMADKNQMIYTQAVLNEIQRFSNIFSINLPRQVIKDGVVINGYSVPKGCGIVPQISVTNNEKLSFANPNIFDPNHFLEADGISLKKIDEFLPFSIGKRMCLGEGLARTELFLIFTSLLQKFRLSVPPNEPEPSLKPVIRFTMTTQPYRCLVERRE